MKQIAQIKNNSEMIHAEFVRINQSFCLVGFHLNKTFTREEGLKIKNQYNMKPTPTGYSGIVPRSLFNGGWEIVIN